MLGFPLPRPVRAGSVISVVAPAGPFDRGAFEAGVGWLRTRYDVRFDEAVFTRTGFLAGDDGRRRDELVAAIENPDVDAVLCARGGYGATRLLPSLDPGRVAAANKLVIGFSDVTALHALWARAGVRSLHAKMAVSLGCASEAMREAWVDAVENPGAPRRLPTGEPLVGGCAEGRLAGGNLAVLAALLGTPFAPPLDGTILFLEDVGERPYRLDRLLTQLTQAGWFDRVAGVVLGAFTEGMPGEDATSVEDVLAGCLCRLGVPVATGLPAGHVPENWPLPFGQTVRLAEGHLESAGHRLAVE